MKIFTKTKIFFIFTFLLSVFFCFNITYAENNESKIIKNDSVTESSLEQKKIDAIKKIAKEKKENFSKKDLQNHQLQSPVNEYGVKMLRALGLIIGVLFIILYCVKKLNCKQKKVADFSKIEILERRNLMPRVQIVLVKIESQKILIGLNQDNISMISIEPKSNFEEILKQKESEC